MLEHAWRTQKLSFAIVLLTSVAYSTLEFAKSQLEWMNQDISEAFNKTRTNPFEFRYHKLGRRTLCSKLHLGGTGLIFIHFFLTITQDLCSVLRQYLQLGSSKLEYGKDGQFKRSLLARLVW